MLSKQYSTDAQEMCAEIQVARGKTTFPCFLPFCVVLHTVFHSVLNLDSLLPFLTDTNCKKEH